MSLFQLIVYDNKFDWELRIFLDFILKRKNHNFDLLLLVKRNTSIDNKDALSVLTLEPGIAF